MGAAADTGASGRHHARMTTRGAAVRAAGEELRFRSIVAHERALALQRRSTRLRVEALVLLVDADARRASGLTGGASSRRLPLSG